MSIPPVGPALGKASRTSCAKIMNRGSPLERTDRAALPPPPHRYRQILPRRGRLCLPAKQLKISHQRADRRECDLNI